VEVLELLEFHGITGVWNSVMVLVLTFFIFWFTFALAGITEIAVSQSFAEKRFIIFKLIYLDKISMLSAALLFGIIVGYLSNDKFDIHNFCRMNPNDKKCDLASINCFSKSTMPIQAVDYGFGQFVKSKKWSDKGIG